MAAGYVMAPQVKYLLLLDLLILGRKEDLNVGDNRKFPYLQGPTLQNKGVTMKTEYITLGEFRPW